MSIIFNSEKVKKLKKVFPILVFNNHKPLYQNKKIKKKSSTTTTVYDHY